MYVCMRAHLVSASSSLRERGRAILSVELTDYEVSNMALMGKAAEVLSLYDSPNPPHRAAPSSFPFDLPILNPLK